MDEEADLNTAGSHDLGGSIPSPSGFIVDKISAGNIPFYDIDLPEFGSTFWKRDPIIYEISKIKI